MARERIGFMLIRACAPNLGLFVALWLIRYHVDGPYMWKLLLHMLLPPSVTKVRVR